MGKELALAPVDVVTGILTHWDLLSATTIKQPATALEGGDSSHHSMSIVLQAVPPELSAVELALASVIVGGGDCVAPALAWKLGVANVDPEEVVVHLATLEVFPGAAVHGDPGALHRGRDLLAHTGVPNATVLPHVGAVRQPTLNGETLGFLFPAVLALLGGPTLPVGIAREDAAIRIDVEPGPTAERSGTAIVVPELSVPVAADVGVHELLDVDQDVLLHGAVGADVLADLAVNVVPPPANPGVQEAQQWCQVLVENLVVVVANVGGTHALVANLEFVVDAPPLADQLAPDPGTLNDDLAHIRPQSSLHISMRWTQLQHYLKCVISDGGASSADFASRYHCGIVNPQAVGLRTIELHCWS